jgi:hypothetical protein
LTTQDWITNPAAEVVVGTETKPGVYKVDITGVTNPLYFDQFRVRILVNSTVETYFRIKIHEQLTLIYDIPGGQNELTVVASETMPFAYDTQYWYKNPQDLNKYIYYKTRVQDDNGYSLVVPFIASAPTGGFSPYPSGYSLQVAFTVEAVQADGGPQNVWGLTVPPWTGDPAPAW